MLPAVIPGESIRVFNYWQEAIEVGMFYRNQLYKKIKVYNCEKRFQAYEDGCRLSESGVQICITVTASEYVLWQNLRTSTLISLSSIPKDSALSFQSLKQGQGNQQLLETVA